MSLRCAIAAVLIVGSATGCVSARTRAGDDGGVLAWDAGARDARPAACGVGVPRVDLLFLIDNSNDMTEQQNALAVELPQFVRALAGGDVDGDGIAEHRGIDDLQTGVVTSDMGTGGSAVTTCVEPMFGDDGRLRTRGNTMIPGCVESYPRFLAWSADDPALFASELTCVVTTGTGGCGFEQPLEALLKAVTPSTSAIRFFGGTAGHGDGANSGLVRDGVLAVVLLTSEEDCSASDPGVFDPDSRRYTGDLNLRCWAYPEAVHPISRYVDGLLALDRPAPAEIVFTVIAGVPTDLVADPDAIDYDAVLADPRMQEVLDTSSPMPRLVPSCDVPEWGVTFPPRRLVGVARGLEARGATTLVQSICQRDLSGPVRAIADRIGDAVDACWR